MIEMKQLKFFVVCAETKSFSRAAEELFTTQPNVSKVIRSLEAELGFTIFVRKNRGIDLTPKGHYAYEYARKVIEYVHLMNILADTSNAEDVLKE